MLAVILGIVAYAPPAVAQWDDEFRFVKDYETKTCVLNLGQDLVGDIVIPDYYEGYKVVGIGAGAFQDNDNITGVHISDNVEVIGDFAFARCKNLKTLKLPYNLREIGAESFMGTELETVYLDNVGDWCSMTINGTASFSNPLKSTYLIINGTETTTVTIPEGVEKIVDQAFMDATITEVYFPSTLKRIGFRSFAFCYNLESLDFPDSLESIGRCCFESCNNLKSYGHENEASNGVNVGWRLNALMFSGFVGFGCGRPEKRSEHLLEFG